MSPARKKQPAPAPRRYPERDARRASPPAPSSQGKGELILLVDDFVDNREMYAQYLSYQNYRVAEAGDGHDALSKAVVLRPDLIVMDLSLPGLDGWEATRRLKRDPATRHIPVVALTGHALAGHAEGAAAAGCDSFVTKPCIPSDLAAEIRRVLDVNRPPDRS